MKRICLSLFLVTAIKLVFGQTHTLDSLRRVYATKKTDSARVDVLCEMDNAYEQNRPDSQLFLAQRALIISTRIKYIPGQLKSLKLMAEAYQYLGNYPVALRYYLQELKLAEKRKNPEWQVVNLISISNVYENEGDYLQALAYEKKAFDLIDRNKLKGYRWYSYMAFGETYEKLNDVRNALSYDKKAYDLAVKTKNDAWLGMCLNNTGNVLVKSGQTDLAMANYKAAIPYLKGNNNESFLCEAYQGVSGLLLAAGRLDSAAFYGKLSLNLAVSRSFNQKYLRSCQLLTSIYRARRLPDSALAYEDKLLAMKDSIYSREKERQLSNLTISEELRQKEMQQELLEAQKNRDYQLKLLLVGLLIPFSFLISLVLSKRKVHRKIVAFSGVISLLMLFEYLTILLHPIVVKWTNHSPFLEILIFVCIAAVLTPSHHRLEHWMLHKLTHHHQPASSASADSAPEGEGPAAPEAAEQTKENTAGGEAPG